MSARPSLSVVIPSWNGGDLLLQNLPAVLRAGAGLGAGVVPEILVVDDASTDDTRSVLARLFPGVGVVGRSERGGFPVAANDGVRAASGEIVVLLNNDARPDPGAFAPLLAHFEASDVFAVRMAARAGASEGPDPRCLRFTATLRRGLLAQTTELGDGPTAGASEAYFADGGASAFRRSAFLELGGFDPIFSPGYSEDVDLSLRAWRSGLRVLYEPQSIVEHTRGDTMAKLYQPSEIALFAERNRLLLAWKHLREPRLVAAHLAWLPVRLARSLVSDGGRFARALAAALVCLPAVIRGSPGPVPLVGLSALLKRLGTPVPLASGALAYGRRPL